MDVKLAEKNFNYCAETLKLKEKLEGNFLILGERLAKILEGELYRPNFETFQDFLEELKISRSTATKLIQIYRVFILKHGFKMEEIAAAGGWSVVSEVVMFATTPKKAIEWLARVQHNNRIDLRKFITEAKTGIKMSECKHRDVYKLTICNQCGDRIKEYGRDKRKK